MKGSQLRANTEDALFALRPCTFTDRVAEQHALGRDGYLGRSASQRRPVPGGLCCLLATLVEENVHDEKPFSLHECARSF